MLEKYKLWLLQRRMNRILRDIYKYVPGGRTTAQLYPFLKALDFKLAVGSEIAVVTDKEEDEFTEAMELYHGMRMDDLFEEPPVRMMN
jgi:alpha-D-ribose 1-methylphosphonate 5-triphosphate synthase subunit PhnI